MKVTVNQAIKKARNNESLEGLVIEGLRDTQVRASDALVLAENGILLPEEHIYYSDDDIAHDSDFDDVEWSQAPLNMTWEEKIALAKTFAKNDSPDSEEVAVSVKIPDREIRRWIRLHEAEVGEMLTGLIVKTYEQDRQSMDVVSDGA